EESRAVDRWSQLRGSFSGDVQSRARVQDSGHGPGRRRRADSDSQADSRWDRSAGKSRHEGFGRGFGMARNPSQARSIGHVVQGMKRFWVLAFGFLALSAR